MHPQKHIAPISFLANAKLNLQVMILEKALGKFKRPRFLLCKHIFSVTGNLKCKMVFPFLVSLVCSLLNVTIRKS